MPDGWFVFSLFHPCYAGFEFDQFAETGPNVPELFLARCHRKAGRRREPT